MGTLGPGQVGLGLAVGAAGFTAVGVQLNRVNAENRRRRKEQYRAQVGLSTETLKEEKQHGGKSQTSTDGERHGDAAVGRCRLNTTA